VRPFFGKGDGTMADFVPGEWHEWIIAKQPWRRRALKV
jgi:hypothetical protein